MPLRHGGRSATAGGAALGGGVTSAAVPAAVGRTEQRVDGRPFGVRGVRSDDVDVH
jgi:hypothetical protein